MSVPLLVDKWKVDPATSKSIKAILPLIKMYLEYPSPNVQGAALVAASSAFDDKSFDKLKSKFSSSTDPVLSARWKQAQARRK
ncbi:MAG: hypothetical protein IPP40_00865 [bacterium]|nr:hypothetical protein [bacterium]